MASCNANTLLTSAIENKFAAVAENDLQWLAVMNTLLAEYVGFTGSINTLLADATTNGFVEIALNDQQFTSVAAQLLCDAL